MSYETVIDNDPLKPYAALLSQAAITVGRGPGRYGKRYSLVARYARRKLGGEIKRLRLIKGLTGSKLCKLAGVPDGSASGVENNGHGEVERIALLLRVLLALPDVVVVAKVVEERPSFEVGEAA